MKVKRLIELLKELNPENDVVISGYEDGVNDVSSVDLIHIERNVNTSWYYGRHEECENVYQIS